MPIIEVPGMGNVEFPDDMTDDQIVSAIQANSPQQKGPSMRYHNTPQETPYIQQMQAGMRRLVAEGRGVPSQMPRQAGIATRATIEGLNSLPGLGADATTDLINRITGKTPALALTVPSEGLPTNAVGNLLDKAGLPRAQNGGEKLMSFGVGATAGSALPQLPIPGKAAPPGFKGDPGLTQTEKTFADARKAGYVVPPSALHPNAATVGAESLAGKAALKQSAQIKNQEVTNQLAKKGLGLGARQEASPTVFREIRQKAGQVYSQVEKLGGEIAAGQDKQYVDDITALGRGSDELLAEFPGANVGKSEEVTKLADSLLQEKFSTKGALEYIKQLRQQSSGNLSFVNAQDPAKRALGYAQRDAAAALEEAVMRNLANKGHGDLAQKFDAARTAIAKSHSAESAFNPATGNFVAQGFSTQLKRGKPLSDEFRKIADFNMAFGQFGGAPGGSALVGPGVSALDAAMTIGAGGLGAATGGPTAAIAALGIPAARLTARYGLLSSPVQNALIRTPAAGPVRPELLSGGLAGLLSQ